MNLAAYQRYTELFNASDFEIRITDAIRLRGRDEMLRFYAFLHAHGKERVEVHRFATSDMLTAVACKVRLRYTRQLSANAPAAQGLARMFPMHEGETMAIPQYLHYHLDVQGRITRVVCVVIMP